MKEMTNHILFTIRQWTNNINTTVFFILFLLIFFTSSHLSAATLHLAVSSNFIAPIKQLSHIFEKETGHKVILSFGSSGKLFAQITHGAPYDVFLSADLTKPKTLIKDNLAYSDSLAIYARGKLALWTNTTHIASDLNRALLDAKRIAIANPKLAPYGKAAEETLRHLLLWDTVKHKLVQGENINQTYQFVYSQNAEVGFVALSQLLSEQALTNSLSESPNNLTILHVPESLHHDINQAAVILKSTKKTALAETFIRFLMRVDTQAKIAQFGYSTEQ